MNSKSSLRVLVIEDSATMQQVCQQQLVEAGFEVDVASSAEQGYALLEEAINQYNPYDGLLLDWLLPTMSGAELLRKIGSEGRFAPLSVMIFTEHPDDLAYQLASIRINTDIQHKSDLPRLGYRMSKFLATHSRLDVAEVPLGSHDRGEKEGRILLVDDSPTVCAIYSDLLHSNGYRVSTANSMAEALGMAQRDGGYQLAIVDYYMPGGNGDEFCEALLSDPRTSSIAVVVHSQSVHVVEESLRSGAIDVIWKEDSNEVFLLRVASIMRTLNLQRQSDQLSVLLTATETLGIGLMEANVFRPFNEVMYQFAKSCGGIQHFMCDDFKQIQLKDLDGEERMFALYPTTGVGDHKMVLVQEVTDLIEALKQAEIGKAKDEFLATMSHELRTPLAAIIGNGEMLAESGLRPDQQQLLHSIDISSRNLLLLVNDILDISKIESGKFECDYAPYDLSVVVDEVCQMFEVALQKPELQFDVAVEAELQYQLWGDGRRVQQVLINLLGNAIKFTQQGRIGLRVWVEEAQIHFSVEDTGIGMSEGTVARLFQPFEQADSRISRSYGGTGLGLHISQLLSEIMGGSIEVSSEFGRGSRFVLTLPLKESELLAKTSATALSAPEASAEEPLSGAILVVEDEPEMQALIAKILQPMGVTATRAENGREALEMVAQQHFDLILMDLQMPVMDGLEATRILRKQGSTIPIVALTANVMAKHQQSFFEAGATDFLQKPIDRKALNRVLRRNLKVEGEAPERLGERAPSCRLLMVDDEQSVLELYRTLFEDSDSVNDDVSQISDMVNGGPLRESRLTVEQYALSFADQGREAVEWVKEGLQQGAPFSVAFIDLRMPPGINGLDTAKLLRKLDQRIYIVFVTAYADFEPIELDQELGYGVLYLEKPFSFSEVRQIVRMLVANWRRDRQLEESLLQAKDALKSLEEERSEAPEAVVNPTPLDDALKRRFSGSILVAEDVPIMQALIRRLLESKGYEVAIAENGEEAVSQATENSFDLILMDMQMPVMDGIEATETLRNIGNTIPIVALTANVMQEHREAFMQAGADGFLEKPIDQAALELVLKEFVKPLTSTEGRSNSAAAELEVSDDLRTLFLRDLKQKQKQLVLDHHNRDLDSLQSLSHSVKGSAQSFGYPRLSELASQLHQTLYTEALNQVGRDKKALLAEIAKVLGEQ